MNDRLYLSILFILAFNFYPDISYSQQVQDYENESNIYRNWLSVHEAVHRDTLNKESIYDQLGLNFYNLYKETGNYAYLIFSLNEAGRSKRSKILETLSDGEIQQISTTFQKVVNRKINDDYYSIRDFSPKDIYIFLGIDIPGNMEKEAKELLDFWLENLPSQYQESQIIGSMKAQALVAGYNKLDDFEKVLEVGRYLIESHPFPNSLFTFNLFNTIAYATRIQGFYSYALRIYEEILFPIAEDLNYNDRYLRAKMDYANTLFRFGDIKSALEEYEYVYSQGIQNLNPRYRPALFNNLAVSYLNSGQFDRYVQFQLEAFEIAQEEQNFDQQLYILRNLFIFYRRQNETQLALNYLNQALELSQQYNLPYETASVLLSLGVYKRETENLPKEALQHFYKALQLSEESDSYQQHFNSYIELGETYYALNNSTKAENYFKEALVISNSRDDQKKYTMAAVRYGNMLTDNNRHEDAERIMQELGNNDLQQIPFDLEVLGKNVSIKLLERKGEVSQALEISSEIIEEVFEWLRESTDMQTGHMRMDEEFSEAFQLHTELLHQRGNYEEAIAITGRLRNLSRTGFYNNPLLKSQILNEEELIRDYNLSNRIEDLRNRYANAPEEQKIYLGNELANANVERNNLLNQAFPNYKEADFEEIVPQAMDKLQSDQMVIYFSVFEDQIFQYFITTEEIDMQTYPADKDYLNLLENAVSSFGQGSTDLNLLHDVYKTFFSENIPADIKHIYMIPDGVFYRIPIEILPTQPVNSAKSYGSSTYLIENYSVSYLNTLSDLVNEAAHSDFRYDLAGFGVSDFSKAGHPELPDLPFSPREVTNSAEKLNKFTNNRFFINDHSTESNFRTIAGKARIIHLATHSKVDDENPLFSSLYLYSGTAKSNGDSIETANDGIVYAYELFDLNLNADLIFLSSCESGSGGYLEGSGILGFSRAFVYAGAQSLLINLWPIRDQTASEISSEFYASLNAGKNKADALREARLHYLNNTNSDPYLWGAFIVYGNIDAPIPMNNNPFLIQLLLSGLLITGLCFFAIFVYQKRALIKSWTPSLY